MSASSSPDNPTATAVTDPRLIALARWENEGGSGQTPLSAEATRTGDAELGHLRMRVIALENLVIALLADATGHQQTIALEMGDYISPRPGCTPHPLTLRAAEAMRSLLDRAERFRPGPQA